MNTQRKVNWPLVIIGCIGAILLIPFPFGLIGVLLLGALMAVNNIAHSVARASHTVRDSGQDGTNQTSST